MDLLAIERELWSSGSAAVAGVDEAGRGCLAGPVVAAAVILKPEKDLDGVVDSKLLTPVEREEAFYYIVENCRACSVCAASAKIIDRINILNATLLAMTRAINRLAVKPDYVIIDGNRRPKDLTIPNKFVIGGDGLSRSIAAASILAKVVRDKLMVLLDKHYPVYGFALHKGYSTPFHKKMLEVHGPSPHHRYSYEPVRQVSLRLDNFVG